MIQSTLLCASDFCRFRSNDVVIRFRQGQGNNYNNNINNSLVSSDSPHSDDGSVAWCSMPFLRRHAVFSGRFLQISYPEKSSSNTITVRIFPKVNQLKTCDDNEDDEILELSSLAFTNLVSLIGTNLHSTSQIERRVFDGRMSVVKESDIPVAQKVTLRRWWCPAGSVHPGKITAFPKPKSLLHLGRWVNVMTSKESHFYEVLEVRDEQDCLVQQGDTFLSQKDTKYRVEQGSLDYTTCPVPPNALAKDWILVQDDNVTPPHPNRIELGRAWTSVPNRFVPPAECLWHVVCHPHEHGLEEAIEAAAGVRQIVSVRGLALHAYRSGLQLIASGGLADKLAGLRQALHDARKAAPSLLVLPDLDHELCPSGMGQDARLRHDQESRILSILLEELNMETNMVNSRLAFIPAVLVVFSTRRSLPSGPLKQHLVWETIALSLPDTEFQSYLWQRITQESPTEAILELLEGRTAYEIETLARRTRLQRKDSTESFEIILKEVCKNEDNQRRIAGANAHVPSVHWSDIGGLAHVRREIMDAIELPLAYPHLFPSGSSRSGILLFGPPGTGKTLVAKAVATECKLPFLSVKGPELLGSYVGESEANVRNIFQEARDRGSRNRPPACVLFFDEMESLAPKRGEQASGGGSVMDRVVATLFGEMDRNSSECQTFCIGATNRPDLLDTSMLRPGRFDRLVYLGIHKADYAKILTAQLRNVKVEGDLELIATAVADILPPTMTGADLSAIVSSALLRATYRLCEKADNEQRRLREKGKDVALDEILRNWTEDESEPVVVLYDLISAANEATPSLTEAELAQYENLKQVMKVT